MKITVKYFGMIAEVTGRNAVEYSDLHDTDSLISKIKMDFPRLKSCKYAVAINKRIATGIVKLNDGDEVALLPPFAGG